MGAYPSSDDSTLLGIASEQAPTYGVPSTLHALPRPPCRYASIILPGGDAWRLTELSNVVAYAGRHSFKRIDNMSRAQAFSGHPHLATNVSASSVSGRPKAAALTALTAVTPFRDSARPTPPQHSAQVFDLIGAPYGIRTRVSALRGPRPRPLDEGSEAGARQIIEASRRRNPAHSDGSSAGLAPRHSRQHARHEGMDGHIDESRTLQVAFHVALGVGEAGAAIDCLVQSPQGG